ncbi:MAG: NADPH:quinone oxidoreductase family protein, partial [Gammaproteobacteria bacterium]|nr:NADPH:quinone oxidoreductase family protein [Gammaproteobacteria bacterium]
MKGVLCEKLGTPDDLVVRDVEEPRPPGEGEVTVALEARGLSFADVLAIAGGYQVRR